MITTQPAACLASVAFLKVRDFARKPVTEQARLRAQLEVALAVTVNTIAPANRIILDAADGAAVVVLNDPVGTLHLAEQILAANTAGLPLCIGLNHGAVQLGGDNGMVGDSIAVAAIIAEFASPGTLLISQSFRTAIADVAPDMEPAIFRAGVFSDASLRTYELYGLERQMIARRRQRLSILAIAAAIAIIGTGVAFRVAHDGHDKILEAALGQVRVTAEEGEHYLRGLLDGTLWQRN